MEAGIVLLSAAPKQFAMRQTKVDNLITIQVCHWAINIRTCFNHEFLNKLTVVNT